MKSTFAVLFLASIASVAYANNPLAGDGALPLSTIPPSVYTGTGSDYLDMTGSRSYLIGCGSLGCGGEFQGMIDTNGTTPGTIPTSAGFVSANFFCVDAQEDFSWGTQGYADVVPLANIDTNASMVRYSDVSNPPPSLPGGPTWTYYPANTGVALPSDAQLRYAMAAYLLTLYDGLTPNSNLDIAGDSTIQQAIWDITSNTTYGASTSGSGTDYAPDQSTYAAAWTDVGLAETACISGGVITSACATNASNWAVVSWDATSATDGTLTSDNHQTFLVQIATPVTFNNNPTPEPSFYGVMGIGVFGLLFGVWRKKRKTQSHTAAV